LSYYDGTIDVTKVSDICMGMDLYIFGYSEGGIRATFLTFKLLSIHESFHSISLITFGTPRFVYYKSIPVVVDTFSQFNVSYFSYCLYWDWACGSTGFGLFDHISPTLMDRKDTPIPLTYGTFHLKDTSNTETIDRLYGDLIENIYKHFMWGFSCFSLAFSDVFVSYIWIHTQYGIFFDMNDCSSLPFSIQVHDKNCINYKTDRWGYIFDIYSRYNYTINHILNLI
jgi:hypothetical protein